MSEPESLGWSVREEDGPTEEERLAWEERQQQREKLSGLMGQYMLKGYRMLGSSCRDCGNILLRTRDGVEYCVYCVEIQGTAGIDSVPHPPDNEAASQTSEMEDSQLHNTGSEAQHGSQMPPSRLPLVTGPPADPSTPSPLHSAISASQDAVLSKLCWATQELSGTSSVEHSTQLCQLIRACADALDSMRHLETVQTTNS